MTNKQHNENTNPLAPEPSFSSSRAFKYFADENNLTVKDFIEKYPTKTGEPPLRSYYYRLRSVDNYDLDVIDACISFLGVSTKSFWNAGFLK